jgi:arylsulfatase A-like enzyme
MKKALFPLTATCIIFVISFFLGLTNQTSFSNPFSVLCQGCNIVVIAIDPLRAEELPCFGYFRNTAPNICAFAQKNIQFTQAYSQSSWTLPSIMSMITSVYPSRHGLFRPPQDILPVNLTTLPEALESAGYTTIYAGETDDDHIPMSRGFGRGFETIIDNSPIEDWASLVKERLITAPTPTFIYFHSFALRWAYAYPQEPFSFEPTFSPPFSLDPDGFTKDMWKESLSLVATSETGSHQENVSINAFRQAKTFEQAQLYFHKLPEDTQRRVIASYRYNRLNPSNSQHMQYLKNIYDDQLHRTDNRLKSLLDILSEPNIAANTIVVFVSNHGDEFGEHGKIGHGRNLFATTTHVPLIFSIPRLKSKTINSIVQNIDIYPTLLSLVSHKKVADIDGKTLMPYLKGIEIQNKNNYAFAQLGPIGISSVRNQDWSYFINMAAEIQEEELYDVRVDPEEKQNVLSSYPTVARDLREKLEKLNGHGIMKPE